MGDRRPRNDHGCPSPPPPPLCQKSKRGGLRRRQGEQSRRCATRDNGGGGPPAHVLARTSATHVRKAATMGPLGTYSRGRPSGRTAGTWPPGTLREALARGGCKARLVTDRRGSKQWCQNGQESPPDFLMQTPCIIPMFCKELCMTALFFRGPLWHPPTTTRRRVL